MRFKILIFVLGLVGSSYPMKGETTAPAQFLSVDQINTVGMEKEIWKPIESLDNKYQVSNFGNVRNNKSKPIKFFCKNGYNVFNPYIDGIKKYVYVHRLVAEAFIPNPDNKPQVNHINSIRDDNFVGNLEWVTCSENIIHGYKFGNITPNAPWKGKFGEKHHASKKIVQMDMAGNEIKTYVGIYEASRIIGVSPSGIIRCCRGSLKSTGGFKFKYIK